MSRTPKSGNSTVWSLLFFATLALFAVTLYAIFVLAPVEQQMGIVQKIFYFHVPSAYAMYVGFAVSAVGSAVYLLKRDPRWDALAVAGAEVGTLFCLIVLLTGPLWARKAWGVWWTWDPRLTRSRNDSPPAWHSSGWWTCH
jgi:heme exporter protein C